METRNIAAYDRPLGGSVAIVKQTFSPPPGGKTGGKRVSFVAGLHGDELEGVYLCHLLIDAFRRLQTEEPEALKGTLNVYPAVNPQALASGTRLWPFFSVDMNRQMGKPAQDSLPAGFSNALLEDLADSSDLVVDIHASNLHLRELPQIRIIQEFDKKLIPFAMRMNADLVWVHPSAGVFESTLGCNLNRMKIPTLVVEMGICLRIDPAFCTQMLDGILHLLHQLDVLTPRGGPPSVKETRLVNPQQVALVQANHSGLFLGKARLGDVVRKDDPIGDVVDPVRGEVLQAATAPASGLLFTLREHPLTYQGAPLCRIALEDAAKS